MNIQNEETKILLLADASPCLRRRVMMELLDFPEDHPEVRELDGAVLEDPLYLGVKEKQHADGSWKALDICPESRGHSSIRGTAQALMRLSLLGFDQREESIQRAVDFLFSRQETDGSWPLHKISASHDGGLQEGYSLVSLQTSLPLRSICACGYSKDERAEKAFDWLMKQQLPDGAWATGTASGVNGYVAGYRKVPHSRWGCRSNTTGALLCLVHHPERIQQPEVQRTMDLLLGRSTMERKTLGFDLARKLGAEPAGGFFTYYGPFDIAMMLELYTGSGVSPDDERLQKIIRELTNWRNAAGLWEYQSRLHLSRWLSFWILLHLKKLEEQYRDSGLWQQLEPVTPFQTYTRNEKRY